MKILQINSHYNQGGAGKIVACIHQKLLSIGCESRVAYGRGNRINEPELYAIGSQYSTYVDAALSRVTGLNGYYSTHGTEKLIAFIQEYKPNIIHLHGLHGYYLNFKILFNYINRKNIPCVWTFHDCHAFVGNCGYHYECEKWKHGCYDCQYLSDYPKSLIFDRTNKMWEDKKKFFTYTDKKIIVTPSKWMCMDTQNSFFNKYPSVVINNGVDTENIFFVRDKVKCRKELGLPLNKKNVLGIAFDLKNPRKGVKYLLQMAKDLSDKIVLILIGWPEKEKSKLEIYNNIICIPFTNNQIELAKYYSAADVFVLPSLAENYATVSIEAMACGTPVVGFDVGGTGEQLAGNRGIIVPIGDQNLLNKAVDDVISDKVSLEYGENLAQYIKQSNSIEKMVNSYVDVYKMLL